MESLSTTKFIYPRFNHNKLRLQLDSDTENLLSNQIIESM